MNKTKRNLLNICFSPTNYCLFIFSTIFKLYFVLIWHEKEHQTDSKQHCGAVFITSGQRQDGHCEYWQLQSWQYSITITLWLHSLWFSPNSNSNSNLANVVGVSLLSEHLKGLPVVASNPVTLLIHSFEAAVIDKSEDQTKFKAAAGWTLSTADHSSIQWVATLS